MEKVKNAIIVSDFGTIEGGATKVAHKTAIALNKQGINVVLFCAVAPVSEELKGSGVDVVCLGQSDILNEKSKIKGVLRGISNKLAKKEFKKLLLRFNPQDTVIHVHNWTKGISSSIFPVAKKLKFKTFITVHDYFLICPNGGLFNYPKKEICDIKPMSIKCIRCNCDSRSYLQKLFRVLRQRKQNKNIRKFKDIGYIFISDFSKREFLRRYDKIQNQHFLLNSIDFDENRYRVACENNDTYLFIGSLTEVKGIRQFCEAVSKAKVKGVVVGQGVLSEELKQAYPEIEFVGWKSKEEMLEYYNRARCLIFSSIWYETMGLAPLEVLAYGIPVICSNLNSATDFVIDGQNGLIYDGRSIDSLVEAIGTAEQGVKELSENAFNEFDSEKYSERKYIEDLLNIYNFGRVVT